MKMISHLKLPEKKSSVIAPGGAYFFGLWWCLVVWDFYNKQSQFHCTNYLIVLGYYSAQSFETPPEVTIFCHDLIHWNINTRTELIGQVRKYLHQENIISVLNGW